MRPEQRTDLIVATVPQGGPQQVVIDVLASSNGAQAGRLSRIARIPGLGTRVDIAIGFTPVRWRELALRPRKGLPDLIMAQRDGRYHREPSIAVIERIGIDAEQRAHSVGRAHRHRSGHDRSHAAVEHGKAGGRGLPVAMLELRKGAPGRPPPTTKLCGGAGLMRLGGAPPSSSR